MVGTGATPGTKPLLLYTKDAGTTWGSTTITTLFSLESPRDTACVGDNLIVVSPDSDSLHYANTSDILKGVETWTEVWSGFVITKDPRAIWSACASHTWIVGEGGYIYFTSDPTNGVVIQDPGTVTTQNLNDVHALDMEYVLAVGDFNAVIFTNDGATWEAIVGPQAGVSLNCCWMIDEKEWLLGSSNGKLWYTKDGGGSYTNIAPAIATEIDDIWFLDDTIGYLAVHVGANGYLYRTTNGGNNWHKMPRTGSGNPIPANDYLNRLAGCKDEPNAIWAVGLADNATAGVIIKAT
jgi:photosystem II stability/assembly factor-like uncharacterized protein